MDEVIDMLFDYVQLAAKATGRNRAPLTAEERGRLLALTRMIPGDGSAPGPDDSDADDGVPVQLTAPGGFETARLVAVSRDGMRLRLAHPVAAGTATVVRVIAPALGFEFAFPCRVAWCDRDQMGIEFDGAPTKTPLALALTIGWNRQLDLRTGWGKRAIVAAA
jgi:PilZ domain